MAEEKDFYAEEIRCDYKIDEKTKRVWAVQLHMLDEVERICKKYGLSYFADSGTLIGAVRHQGYIPWDDDIDLVMLREDYEKFVSLAQKELPDHMKLQTVYTEKNYLRGHAQIRDSRTTGCNEEDKKAGYNCGIFLDIFPLDNVPEGKFAARWWAGKIKFLWMLLYTWYRFDYYENKTAMGKCLYAVGKCLNIPMKKAYGIYEAQCKKYGKKQTEYVCDTVFIRHFEKNLWKREWFEDAVYLPFENRKIPAPKGYDARLKTEYGDYMKPAKAPTMHGGLYLDPDTPYEEYFQKENKKAASGR